MFGLEFLFTAALYALPLAALPLILHLLHRRKSPVVPFPTLKFIKGSLQQSAARRKIQRWLLLAIRMLLLALLIWAVAQPAKTLASRFFSSASNSAAVIVLDTSWSMNYRENQITLLNTAEQMVQDLLRNQLKDSTVLLVSTSGAKTPTFRSATERLSNWTPLRSEVASKPLLDRIQEGLQTLEKSPAGEKLLVVLSDFQAREFPRAVPEMTDRSIRLIALDLHPQRPRSAGIRAIHLNPKQPIPGVRSSVQVEVAGPAGEVRPVSLTIRSASGKMLLEKSVIMANLDDAGQGQVQFNDIDFATEQWQLVTARLSGEDPMEWDDARAIALEMPGRQRVTVLDRQDALASARRVLRLAIDPHQGRLPNWPLTVAAGNAIKGDESAVVLVLDQVPDAATLSAVRSFVSSGGTAVLMLRPGIEQRWQQAPADAKSMLEALVPSAPYQSEREEGVFHAAPLSTTREDPATAGLAEEARNLELLRFERFVRMTVADPSSTRILLASTSAQRRVNNDRDGLLYIRRVGRGRVYTWSVVPDSTNTNLATHGLFLPLLVNQCLRPPEGTQAGNSAVGEPITMRMVGGQAVKEMEIKTPAGELFRVVGKEGDAARIFAYTGANAPGIYEWRRPGDSTLRNLSSVNVPGEESEASYRAAEQVIPQGENILVAHSMEELAGKVQKISQPQPKWSLPIAIALMLLCVEGLLSTENRLWKWLGR